MEPQWDRLAEAVRVRRTSRGWSQAAVTERGGPSDTLQNRIEAGRWKPVRGVEDSLRKIDAGMEWRAGSASRILSGGEPIEIESSVDMAAATGVDRPVSGPHPASSDIRHLEELAKIIEALNRVITTNTKQTEHLARHPATSPELRITLLEGMLRSVDAYAEFLITAASQSSDPQARKHLGETFAARADVEKTLSDLMGQKELLKKRGPGAVTSTEHIRHEVPDEILSTYTAAGSATAGYMTAISTALSDGKPVTTSMTRQLLTAIDDYAAATRRVVNVVQDNGPTLTPQEVEAALPFFETADEYVGVILEFLDVLAPGAPNAEEIQELAARRDSLEALSKHLMESLREWSNPKPSGALIYDFSRARRIPPPPDIDDLDVAASRREKRSDGERDDDE